MADEATCAIIGAGMTGLVAAERLTAHGVGVTVFDKSPRPGGRIATRTTHVARFDHGAPGLEAEAPEFASFLTGLGATSGPQGRYVGPAGMRSLFDPLVARLRVKWAVPIASVLRRYDGWVLLSEGGGRHGPFDALMVTMPAPQAAHLIDGVANTLSAELASVQMEPVWTGMISFAKPVALPTKMAGGECVAQGGIAPGRPAQDWVIHMGPNWTEQFLENDPAFTAVFLREEIERTTGERLPPAHYLAAHRWRFARARVPLGRPCLRVEDKAIWAGGDWTLGRTAEAAWSSGRAMAEEVAQRLA